LYRGANSCWLDQRKFIIFVILVDNFSWPFKLLTMETLYQQFGQRVSLGRSLKKLNQADLGKLCDMGRATIATIEAGRQSVTLDQAYKICLALEATLTDMLPPLSVTVFEKSLEQVSSQVDQINPQDMAAIKSLLVSI
jgi:transcriptional regulator with XRE-family HTH domain